MTFKFQCNMQRPGNFLSITRDCLQFPFVDFASSVTIRYSLTGYCQFHLQSDRLKQVLDYLNSLNSLCVVLGTDFKETIKEIHPSLDDSKGTKNVSIKTMERLSTSIQRLREVKIKRFQKVGVG